MSEDGKVEGSPDWMAEPAVEVSPEAEGKLPVPGLGEDAPEAFAPLEASETRFADGGPLAYVAEPQLEGFSGPVDDIGGLAAQRHGTRTPNLADALLFLAALAIGLLLSSGVAGLAVYFHWFGVKDLDTAAKSTPVSLGIELLVYSFGLGLAVPFFRYLWGKGYFEGLHWGGARAYRVRFRLVGVALGCNLLAAVVNLVLKFPENAPIDKMFTTTADAWMLAGFGVVVAPFFEEMIFRGFFLPAMATAWDWCVERATGAVPRELDAEGNPRWSVGAMVFAALLVSAPFAWIHSEQVGAAWGPLVLLYCVSLALCAVRLAARSLAASTLTHSAYNLMLFALMFAQTDGFRHMEKM